MSALAMRVQIVLDCQRAHELADWWAETLGWSVEPQDEDFIRRMIAEGHADEDDTDVHRGRLVWRGAAAVVPPEDRPDLPRLYLQEVPEPKQAKNRVHLDLRPADGTDLDELRAALEARGATRVGEGRQGPHTWVVLADPEGNEFCVATH